MPHVVFGSNTTTVVDVEGAISRINELLSETLYIPRLDIGDGILIRLDICYNFQVGELVQHYINALQFLDYPYKKTMRYEKNGISYNSRAIYVKFYNKFNQCREIDAYGILRQEHELKKREIQKVIGKSNPTLGDIDFNKIADVLEVDLIKLGLYGHWINTPSRVSESLCKKYGLYGGIYLYGLLCLNMSVDKHILPTATNFHPRSLDRQLQKINEEIEMPLTMTDFVHPLPPLKIDRKIFLKKS